MAEESSAKTQDQPSAEFIEKRLDDLGKVFDDLDIIPSNRDEWELLKREGNRKFETKNYLEALDCYKYALSLRPNEESVVIVLINNISATNYYLGRFEDSLEDALLCLEHSKTHQKCYIRALSCCLELNKFDQFDLLYKKYESLIGPCKKSEQLLKDYDLKKKHFDKIAENREFIKRERKELMNQIRKREISLPTRTELFSDGSDYDSDDLFEDEQEMLMYDIQESSVKVVGLPKKYSLRAPVEPIHHVYLDEKGVIHWPAIIYYPEFGHCDLIKDIPENFTLRADLAEVLKFSVASGNKPCYTIDNIEVYLINKYMRACLVDIDWTMERIIKTYCSVVRGGRPEFFVVSPGSTYFETFKNEYQIASAF